MSHETAPRWPPTAKPKEAADVVADPANDDSEDRDWSSEGGATREGPATGAASH